MSCVARKRKHSDSDGGQPPSYETRDVTNRNLAAPREAPASHERISADRWENSVARDNAAVHNGHTFIQHHYNGNVSGPQQAAQGFVQRINFVEALHFDYMDSRYESVDAAHINTCRWLFQKSEYHTWRSPEHLESHHGFLWIKGKAGSGKSTLMKCAFEHAEKSFRQDKIISFFFNARGQHLEKSVEGMYRTLLFQLIRHFPHLRSKLPNYGPESIRQHGWAVSALKNYLGRAVQSLGHDKAVTIFIDALDECDEDDIREAIEHLEDLCSAATLHELSLRICFASRYYPRVSMKHCVEINLEDQSEHQRDIRTYIDHKLTVRHAGSRSALATQIEMRSSGVFLWVVLVVRLIKKKCDAGASHSQLLHILEEVPDELQQLIGTVVHLPDKSLLCTLVWILFAERPLRLEEFYFAVLTGTDQLTSGIWDPSEIDRDGMEAFVLAASRGLVEIISYETLTRAQLIHESVREYLLAGGLAALEARSDATSVASSHLKLFSWCQTYLRFDTEDHVATTERRDTRSRDDVHKTYPLLSYAGDFALNHFEASYTAGLVPLGSLNGFPLKQAIYLATFYDLQLYQQLLNPSHFADSMMYLMVRKGCTRLAGAFLAANVMVSHRFDYVPDTSATASSYNFRPAEINVNSHFGGPWSNLLELAIDRCPDLVRPLLDQDADVNPQWGTPLQRAVSYYDQDAVELLLSRGAEVHGHRPSLLTLAVKGNHIAIAKLLLKYGADVNGGCDHPNHLVSPLLAALGHGDTDSAALGNDEHCKREFGFDTLSQNITRTLLDHGADLNLKAGPDLISPLEFAIGLWGRDVVQLLIDHGPPHPIVALDVLVCAANRLNVEVVQLALERSPSAEVKARALRAALIAADRNISRCTELYQGTSASEARISIVGLLLDAGVYLEGFEGDCEPALVTASAAGHRDLVKLLLERGTDSQHRSGHYETAIQAARLKGYDEVVQLLEAAIATSVSA